MTASRFIFPVGVALTIGGVLLAALTETLSLRDNPGWALMGLVRLFSVVLFTGTALGIIGSFIERNRLTLRGTKVVGLLCWTASAASVLLLALIGNVHTWTFTFFFPAFMGFVSGGVLLSKTFRYW